MNNVDASIQVITLPTGRCDDAKDVACSPRWRLPLGPLATPDAAPGVKGLVLGQRAGADDGRVLAASCWLTIFRRERCPRSMRRLCDSNVRGVDGTFWSKMLPRRAKAGGGLPSMPFMAPAMGCGDCGDCGDSGYPRSAPADTVNALPGSRRKGPLALVADSAALVSPSGGVCGGVWKPSLHSSSSASSPPRCPPGDGGGMGGDVWFRPRLPWLNSFLAGRLSPIPPQGVLSRSMLMKGRMFVRVPRAGRCGLCGGLLATIDSMAAEERTSEAAAKSAPVDDPSCTVVRTEGGCRALPKRCGDDREGSTTPHPPPGIWARLFVFVDFGGRVSQAASMKGSVREEVLTVCV